jgi:hypothetical protein
MKEATSAKYVWLATCLQPTNKGDMNTQSAVNTWLYGCGITDSRVKVLAPRKTTSTYLFVSSTYVKLLYLKHNNGIPKEY